MGTERIKIRILIPLTIALIGLLGVFITGSFRLLHHNLDDEVQRHLTSVRNILRAQHHENLDAMSIAATHLKQDETVRRAFQNGERSKLYAALLGQYRELKANHYITHLYLHDTTGRNFIRMHDSSRYNDVIDRFTTTTAVATREPAYGLDLCKRGQFMMRVVIPWFKSGELIGYIELGKELTDITRRVPATLGISTLVLLDKKQVTREAWESVRRTGVCAHGWEEFPRYLVVDGSVRVIPPGIKDWLAHADHQHSRERIRMESEGKTFWTAFIPLVDAEAREVGDLVVFFDATAQIADAYNLLYTITGLCLALGLALFISFYKMLGAIETELTESRRKMLAESQARLEIEKRHARELSNHVVELERARARANGLARQAEQARQIAQQAQKDLMENQRVKTGKAASTTNRQ